MVLGGQHMIYVTNSVYDECQSLVNNYNGPQGPPPFTTQYKLLRDRELIWASLGYMKEGTSMQGAKQNIPPSEVTFKLRVSTPYQIRELPTKTKASRYIVLIWANCHLQKKKKLQQKLLWI
jgi:hypothetical protein